MRCLGASAAPARAPVTRGEFVALGCRGLRGGLRCWATARRRCSRAGSPTSSRRAAAAGLRCRRCRASLIGLVLLLGFAMPPLLQLRNVPALRVLRRDVGAPQQRRARSPTPPGSASLGALLVWQAGDVKLGAIVLGGFVAAFAVLRRGRATPRCAAPRRGCALRQSVRGATASPTCAAARAPTACRSWRSAWASRRSCCSRSRAATCSDTWRAKMPADAPNRFVHQHPARPAARRDGVFSRDNGLAAPRPLPDGARPPRGGERRARSTPSELRGPARQAPGRARVQPLLRRAPARPQPDRRRRAGSTARTRRRRSSRSRRASRRRSA